MARIKSLRSKFVTTMLLVAGMIGLSTLGIVVYLNTKTSEEHLREIQVHIEQGLRSKGKVLTENHARALRGLALDNAFLDMQRLVFRAVAEDQDVAYGIFVGSDGETLAFARNGVSKEGDVVDKQAWKGLGLDEKQLQVSAAASQRATRLGADTFEFAAPVVGEENEQLGTIRYGLSTERMQSALVEARKQADGALAHTLKLIGALVGLATLIGLLLARLQAVRITKPVGELTHAATQLAGGDRKVRVTISSGDELQVLGGSFNKMVEELDASYGQLEQLNRTLELKVEERTAQLGAKNRDMRLVLDNVDQGFITLSPDGIMATERSKVVDTWFGQSPSGQAFGDYISRHSPAFGIAFQMAWEQLKDGFLPFEMCLEQLPSRLSVGIRTWELRYLPFGRDTAMDGLLVVVSEITERLLKEREEAEQSELMQGFKKLMLDRSGFAAFLRDGSQMVKAITCGALLSDLVIFKRTVHTLKGNCALMGLSVVARLCHTIEEQTEEEGRPGAAILEELERRWQAINEHIAGFIGGPAQRVIEVPLPELTALIARMSEARVDDEALRTMLNWQLEPIERPFERLASQARALARRLGKGEITIEIQGNGVRLEPETWSPFFGEMAHLIRNAVDHGLETPAERDASEKATGAALTFTSKSNAHNLTMEFSDNGRGIDWDKISEKAEALGLPHKTPDDLLDALCHDGVSTRDEVTETSGRGVGMAALKQRIEHMGGKLQVRSKRNVGTTWIVQFPWSPKEVPTARLSRPPSPANDVNRKTA